MRFSESWDGFSKRALVEKHSIGIVCENPRGHGTPLPHFADAHGMILK